MRAQESSSAQVMPTFVALARGRRVTGTPSVRHLEKSHRTSGTVAKCSKCHHAFEECGCDGREVPWMGNISVNDGHENFSHKHLYRTWGGLVASFTTTPATPVVYAFANISSNLISVAAAPTYTVADLAMIGLVATTTTTAPIVYASRWGQVYVIAGLAAPNASFNGMYRIVGLPSTTDPFFVLENLNVLDCCNSLNPAVGDFIRITVGNYAQIYLITAIDPVTGAFTLAPTALLDVAIARRQHIVACDW